MSARNTLQNKLARRVARALHKEQTAKSFNDKLHHFYVKKYPVHRAFINAKGEPVFVSTRGLAKPKSPVVVSRKDVKRHVYLAINGLPHSQRVASLGTVVIDGRGPDRHKIVA